MTIHTPFARVVNQCGWCTRNVSINLQNKRKRHSAGRRTRDNKGISCLFVCVCVCAHSCVCVCVCMSAYVSAGDLTSASPALCVIPPVGSHCQWCHCIQNIMPPWHLLGIVNKSSEKLLASCSGWKLWYNLIWQMRDEWGQIAQRRPDECLCIPLRRPPSFIMRIYLCAYVQQLGECLDTQEIWPDLRSDSSVSSLKGVAVPKRHGRYTAEMLQLLKCHKESLSSI